MSNTALFKEALTAGEGVVRLAPCWVPRSFLMPGGRLKLDPRDLYALGAHRGGIDERWFSSTTNAANGPAHRARRRPELHRVSTARRVLLKDAIETVGDQFLGADVMREYGGWNLLCKFFDNLGPDPAPHAPERRARRARRPEGQARSLLLPAAVQLQGQQLPLHVHGPRARHHAGRRPPLPGALERGRQRHPLSFEGLPAEARHRLADRRRHPARARLAGDLRAAGELRRLRHVPVAGRRPRRAVGAAGEGRPARAPPRPRLHHRHARLGRERRSRIRRSTACSTHARAAGERNGRMRAIREKWVVYSTGYYSAKELTVFPGRTVHDSRRRRLRTDRGAGLGIDRQAWKSKRRR